jgi:hypothetical protein
MRRLHLETSQQVRLLLLMISPRTREMLPKPRDSLKGRRKWNNKSLKNVKKIPMISAPPFLENVS